MRNNLWKLSLIIIIFPLLSDIILSCDPVEGYEKSMLKPNAKKNYGELLFAIDKKYWKNKLGFTIKSSFEKLIKTTPLPYEKEFNIDFIVPKKIIKNIKLKNCIIFINIKDYFLEEPNTVIKKDLWAKGQLVIELNFKSEESAINYFKYKISSLKNEINEFYISSISSNYTSQNILNRELGSEIEYKYKVSNGFKLNKKEDNFWWFSDVQIKKDQNGSHEVQKGILIYKQIYYHQRQFDKANLIKTRDSICYKYLRGKNNTTYMKTQESSLYQIENKVLTIRGKYFSELNGCWTMINDKMGGSFISLSTLSKNKKYIITIEGYLYAPNFEKQTYLKEIKAILYSPFIKRH